MKLVFKHFFRKYEQYRKKNDFETMGKMLAFAREKFKEKVHYLYNGRFSDFEYSFADSVLLEFIVDAAISNYLVNCD